MDSMRALVEQYLRAAWRRRWIGVIVAWLICGLGWVGVYLAPNQFESSARLYVDADAILTPLLRGLAADSASASQLEVLQSTLLSRPNLEKLVSKTDLDLTITSPSDKERLLAKLAKEVHVQSQSRNLFTITYRNPSPKLAHDVVQTLLTLFVEAATGSNRTDMENARRFLEHQISSYEQQLRAAEKRRADFRTRYIDILPSDMNPSAAATESARGQVRTVEGTLQDAIIKRDTLRQEVANTPPMLVVEAGYGPLGTDPGNPDLKAAEDQLRMLLLKDTEQHPDVIAQKKLIAALRAAPLRSATPAARVAAGNEKGGAAANEKGGAGGNEKGGGAGAGADRGADRSSGQRSAPNPVYDQLKVKLIEADTDVSTLQRQKDVAMQYLDRLEKIQREQPGLIAEFENMDRDYGVLRKNYEELLGRLQSANIAQAADTQADKVKLQIVDPPETPRLPAAPNRMFLITGVLLAGIGGGIGLTVLLGQLDRSFSTADDLRSLGLPVIGGISILGLPPLRQRLLTVARFSAAVAVLVVVYGGLMVHILRTSALI
jgi:polysaccharide chain length determinant protein (PEP-CTERM system associated)